MPLAHAGSSPSRRVFVDGAEVVAMFYDGVAVPVAFDGDVEQPPAATNNEFAHIAAADKPALPTSMTAGAPAGWTSWLESQDVPDPQSNPRWRIGRTRTARTDLVDTSVYIVAATEPDYVVNSIGGPPGGWTFGSEFSVPDTGRVWCQALTERRFVAQIDDYVYFWAAPEELAVSFDYTAWQFDPQIQPWVQSAGTPTLAVSITGAAATLAETGFFDLAVTIGGTATGDIDYLWAATAGTFGGGEDPARDNDPRYTPPDVETATGVTLSVVVRRGGATATAQVSFTVTPVANPPPARAVILNPISTIQAGARHNFDADILDGTGPVTDRIWGATRGTIVAGGIYTAPSTAGADTVTFSGRKGGVLVTDSSTFDVLAGTLPGQVGPLTASGYSQSGFTVSCGAPATGTTPFTYQIRYKTRAAASYGAWSAAQSSRSFTLAGLAANTTYDVQARAVNSVGAGPERTGAFVTRTTPPPTTLTVAIQGVTNGQTLSETSFADLSAAVGGTATGTIGYLWSITAGQLTPSTTDDDPRFNPPDVSANTAVTISLTITRGGRTASASVTITVTPVTTVPAPYATILNPINTIQAGARHNFDADILGGTGPVTDRQWSAGRGTIAAGGIYTAPATAGADSVTFQGRKGGVLVSTTDSFTVLAPPPALRAAIFPTAPNVIAGQDRVFTCSVSGGTGTPTFAWSVEGGTFAAASAFDYAGDSIRFTAGSSGSGSVSCTVTRGGETDSDTVSFNIG